MILAIDIGNTNIVLGGIVKDDITFTARLATDRIKTEDQYAVDIKNILELYQVSLENIRGVIISSVVPPVRNAVRAAAQRLTGRPPIVLGPGVKTGLNIVIDNPGQLGCDLVANAVAALKEYPMPCIIFDMGTATTISALGKQGQYLGGCIIPGVKVSLDALSAQAAQLPGISLEEPKNIIGKNTIECMRSGIINGNAAMVDGMIERMEEELGGKATVLATGGIAQCIVPHCKREVIYDENLLLKGLAYIYHKNA
jgi:type III pantothenate kinase